LLNPNLVSPNDDCKPGEFRYRVTEIVSGVGEIGGQ